MPRLLLLALLLGAFAASAAHAQAPERTSYQGLLTDPAGTPVPDGPYALTFRLYAAAAGGSALWTEAHPAVAVEDGVFSVELGAITSLAGVPFDAPRFLSIQVGANPELSPRTPLLSNPYAWSLRNLRVIPETATQGPNLIGGWSGNSVGVGVRGATIGGGGRRNNPNTVMANFGTIGGGERNTASGSYATIGGGNSNDAVLNATVGGGVGNTAGGASSTVGGGSNNAAGEVAATVGGGMFNTVTADYGTVGGGEGNSASDFHATVGGGHSNAADGSGAAIGGGESNAASGTYSTIGGGNDNDATGGNTVVGGGFGNRASGLEATVGGGRDNVAGKGATVGGGFRNRASGEEATVPGGDSNHARGHTSFAAGYHARAAHDGTFVWTDFSVPNDSLVSTGPNQFLIRAAGGVGIGTNAPPSALSLRAPNDPLDGPTITLLGTATDQAESGRIRFVEGGLSNWRGAYVHFDGSANRLHIGIHDVDGQNVTDDVDVITVERNSHDVGIGRTDPQHPLHVGTNSTNGNGAHVTAGGTWTNGSSRAFKEAFQPVDPQAVLAAVAALPVSRWRYRGAEGEGAHLGPMAEDFAAAFGLGSDERYIATVDADGVALAAIQGLLERVEAQEARIAALEGRLAALEARLNAAAPPAPVLLPVTGTH